MNGPMVIDQKIEQRRKSLEDQLYDVTNESPGARFWRQRHLHHSLQTMQRINYSRRHRQQ